MKTREKTAIFPLQLVPEWAAMTKIPCIFPDDQGIRRGEQFVSDCGIRHPVRDFCVLC